jgi:hypothetical protein
MHTVKEDKERATHCRKLATATPLGHSSNQLSHPVSTPGPLQNRHLATARFQCEMQRVQVLSATLVSLRVCVSGWMDGCASASDIRATDVLTQTT